MRNTPISKIILFILFCPIALHSQNYWQQEVNYKIQVTLDDENHSLYADEEFQYINNSPDTLKELYIHLWPNAYKDRNSALAKQSYKNGNDELYYGKPENRGWIDSLDFKIDDRSVSYSLYEDQPDIALIYLENPLVPGDTIHVSTPFRVKIPSGRISRLGHIDQSYQMTQWYPKPAVYDKNGWNPMPYLNQGEFYSEFGSFDVLITLPANYVVGATGDLQTDSEKRFMNELAERTKKNIVDIVNEAEKDKKTPFPPSSEQMKTIRFTQNQVHDFAWFADKRYAVLKGEVKLPHTSRLVTSWAMFVPQNAKLWQHAIEYLNDGTFYYSKWNGDYPYNQVTAVDGTISAGGGMEYPNVTVIGNSSSKEELEIVIVHEVGHNWFYGILGSNERVHGWMDEGINTLNEVRYIQTKYPGNTRLSDMVLNGRFHLNELDYHDMGDLMYRIVQITGYDQPIETHSKQFSPANYGIVMYQKTGLVFHYLKDYLGDKEFDRVMHIYFDQWKFKHPQPEDLRVLFEIETAKDLSWLFTDLIQTTKHVDYKIQSVKKSKDDKELNVRVKNVGQVNGPIEINVFDRNGEMVESKWIEPGEQETTIETDRNSISKVIIDEGKDIPELSRHNNTWRSKALFHKWEPLKLEFLIGDHESDRTNVFWTPSIAGNAYDKLMLGLVFHNFGAPPNTFQYLIAPHYSFGGKRISGISELSYTLLPKTRAKMIKIGTSIKSFANSNSSNSYYIGISPYLRVDLGSRNKSSSINQQLTIKGLWRDDVYAGVTKSNFGFKGIYTLNGGNPDFKWGVEGTVTYYQDYDGNERVFRGEIEGDLSFKYLRKMEKWISARFYYGQNFLFDSPYYWNDHMQLAMSGARGYQDLFLEEYNFERNASGGQLWAQQRNDNQGGFYSTSDFGTTRYWMGTFNVTSHMPFIPNMFELFSNQGLFYDGTEVGFMFNSGIGVKLGDVVGVYFPLLRSENMGKLFDSYGREIRFTLKFNIFDKGLNLSRFI